MVNSSASGAGGLLAGGFGGEHDTDDEPLRALRQVVQVDDGDLLVAGADRAGRPVSGRSARISAPQRLQASCAAGG